MVFLASDAEAAERVESLYNSDDDILHKPTQTDSAWIARG